MISNFINLNFFLLIVGQVAFSLNDNSEPSSYADAVSTNRNINILVWGGGYSPLGNQISLESNVRYFHRIKNKIGLEKFTSRTLFADGVNKARDIQFRDPNFVVSEANLIIAEMFGSTRGLYNQYRDNLLNAYGSSSENELDKWLNDLNSTPQNSINIIYFTGHGGKGDKKTPHNTSTHLWNNQKVKVSELTDKLDSLPETQSVILIMVQCYSGGFANFIFNHGNPKKELHPQTRAGFFATTHDRVAAGCTPDIREANYQEYSTKFWEALCGESRIGQKIQKPDYNGDQLISLSEAHAYVVINSNTVDIPVKTSDIFLRKFSTFELSKDSNVSLNKSELARIDDKTDSAHLINSLDFTKPQVSEKEWLFCTSPISKILSHASKNSKTIIVSLSKRLGLIGDDRFDEADKKINEYKKKRDELSKTKKQKEDECKQLKNKIKERLRTEWPELANTQHPKVDEIKKSVTSLKLISTSNQDSQWDNFKKLKKQIATIENERFTLEKNQVLALRLKYAIENVVLKNALPYVADRFTCQKLRDIESLENSSFEQLKNQDLKISD